MNASEYCVDGSDKFKVFSGDDSKQYTTRINYIHVSITDEEKNKIISALGGLVLVFPNFLALFWAAEKIREAFVLTTSSQPFGLRGNNKKLESYLKACKNHNQYVHAKKGNAIGLAAQVFMSGKPEQTQNVHNYPEDQRPPCDDIAIFYEKWGSFAVIVGLPDKQRLGVLQIVTDTIKKSYDDDSHRLCIALEKAGLQCRCFSKLADPRMININDDKEAAVNEKEGSRKITRNTISKKMARYNLLAPLFGLPAFIARERLREICDYDKSIAENTFKKSCKLAHISEWPGKPLGRKQNECTAGGRGRPKNSTRSSSSTAPIRQTASEMEHDQAVILHSPDAMGVQHFDTCVMECTASSGLCNEMRNLFIQSPDKYGYDASMDFQCHVEPPFFDQEFHEIGNPYHVPSQTSSEMKSAFGISNAIGGEWLELERERSDFMQDFERERFQTLSV